MLTPLSANDVFFDCPTGALTINGDNGDDEITLTAANGILLTNGNTWGDWDGCTATINIANITSIYVFGDSGNDAIDLSGVSTANGFPDLNKLITIDGDGEGNPGNDNIVGSAFDDIINGNGGVDHIWGGAGDDVIEGNGGVDTIWGGAGDDKIKGGGGNDILHGDDELGVYAGNDELDGDSGNDQLFGGAGDDELNGDEGDDSLFSEAGNDTYVFLGSDGLLGSDTLTETGANETDALDFTGFDRSITVSLLDPQQQTINTDGQTVWLQIDLNSSATFENVFAARNESLDDTITGNNLANILQGFDGADTINGGAGNDVIEGGNGIDILSGGGGNDTITGGDGDDIIVGGNGINFLNGNGFADGVDQVDASNESRLETPPNLPASDQLTEASGLVVSRALHPTSGNSILWIVQDDGPTWLYANNTDGSTLGYFPLGDASGSNMALVEWEDMAFYDDGSTKYIYIADIGDNDSNRTSITFYRFAEPTVPTGDGAHAQIGDAAIERIVLKYPIDPYDNGRARDAETLMVDPLTGDIFIVSKSERDPATTNAHLYRIGSGSQAWALLSDPPPATGDLTDEGAVAFPAGTKNLSPSAGDISFDGMEVLLKSDDVLHHYARKSTDDSFADLLTVTDSSGTPNLNFGGININGPVQIPTAKDQHNRESVAFAPGADGFYTISENGSNGTNPRPVQHYALGVNTPSGQDEITAGSGDIIRELLVNLTDDGNPTNPRPGTLRRAIEFANGRAGTDTITVTVAVDPNRVDSVVSLQAVLPVITEAITLDNLNGAGSPRLIIDGSGAGAGVNGLVFETPGQGATVTMLNGIAVQNFDLSGILIRNDSRDVTINGGVISGNNRGIEIAGSGTNSIQNITITDTKITDSDDAGIRAGHVNVLTVKGSSPIPSQTSVPNDDDLINSIAKSVIAGNGALGIQIFGTIANVLVENTAIVDNNSANGQVIIGGGSNAVDNVDFTNNIVGSLTPRPFPLSPLQPGSGIAIGGIGGGHDLTGNIIVGVEWNAIRLGSGKPATGATNTIAGNQIGLFPLTGGNDANVALGRGIYIYKAGGGTFTTPVLISDNEIANITEPGNGDGITVANSATAVEMTGNLIWDVADQPIDLGEDGPTLNDPGDIDEGANNLQNYPEFVVVNNSSGTTGRGVLRSVAAVRTYQLEFFSQTDAQSMPVLLTPTTNVTTDANGEAVCSIAA